MLFLAIFICWLNNVVIQYAATARYFKKPYIYVYMYIYIYVNIYDINK